MGIKYAFGIVLILTILLSSIQVAVAEKPELPDHGTTPDSWMYGFKRFREGVDMFFTFDDLAKGEKHVNYAGLRLSEAKAMAERGKPEFVDSLVKEYGENINASNEIAKKAQQIGKNVTKVTELVGLATSVHLDVLDEVYEKAPEQAKEAILKAKDASMNGQKNALRVLSEDNPKKAANINLDTVKSRLSKAKEMAERGKSKGVEQALEEYEEMTELSKELAEKDADIAEDVAADFNEQLVDLDEIEDKAPEDIKEKVKEKKSSSLEKQRDTLRSLAKNKPEKAAEIYSKAAEARLNRAKAKAEENEIEEVEDEIEEFEKLADFGNEISQIAQGLGKDTTTVDQLVANATSHHLDVLAEVYAKVPKEAKPAIEKAMNKSVRGREKAVEALKEKDAFGGIPKEKIPAIAKEKKPSVSKEPEKEEEVEVKIPETPEVPEQPEIPETGQIGRP